MKITHKIIMCMLLVTGFEMYAGWAPHTEEVTPNISTPGNTGKGNSKDIPTNVKVAPPIPIAPAPPFHSAPSNHPEGYDRAVVQTVNDSGFDLTGISANQSVKTATPPIKPPKPTSNTTGTKTDANGVILSSTTTDNSGKELSSVPNIIPTDAAKNGRSTLQALSNKINNASSMIGNKKTTTTDSSGNTTVTTDQNGILIASKTTNNKGEIIQTVRINPLTGAKITVKYYSDTSTITTIDTLRDPNNPITEIRNKNGTLIDAKDKNGKSIVDASGKPIATEDTVSANDIKQLTTSQGKFPADLVTKIISNNTVLQQNDKVFGQGLASLLSDANARIKRFLNLDRATRDTIQKTLKELQSAENKKAVLGKYTALTKKNADGKPITDEQAHKQTIAELLIKSQIDNVFGTNPLSGRSNFSLVPEMHQEIVDLIKNSKIFDSVDAEHKPIPDYVRQQAIADMADAIMNMISAAPDGSNQPPIATFKTQISPDSSYKSIITNDTGTSTTSMINASGALTGKVFAFPAKTTNDRTSINATTFTTTVDPKTGATSTVMSQEGQPDKSLTTYEDSLIQMAHDQLKAMANARSIIKATLWTGKQIAMNIIPSPVSPVHAIWISALAIPTIKIGSMLMGYKYSDPTVRTTITAAVEFTCGNSRGWLSADPNKLFTTGSAPKRVIDTVQGTAQVAYNSLTGKTSTPLTDIKKVVTNSAKTDPNEEYYHSLDDSLIEAATAFGRYITGSDTLTSSTPSTNVGRVTKLVSDSIASLPMIGVAGNKVVVFNS